MNAFAPFGLVVISGIKVHGAKRVPDAQLPPSRMYSSSAPSPLLFSFGVCPLAGRFDEPFVDCEVGCHV